MFAIRPHGHDASNDGPRGEHYPSEEMTSMGFHGTPPQRSLRAGLTRRRLLGLAAAGAGSLAMPARPAFAATDTQAA
ncbi:MAG: hypothetical protein JNM64_13815, partial [Chloroflexia bacterium]|nr:hypothetical protein [Chloroflexia bacterium]